MNFDELYSDYGTGSSTDSSPWGSQESWTDFQSQLYQPEPIGRRRSSSFADCITGIADFPLEAIMEEFRLNGLDSPYDPEEEAGVCQISNYEVLSGMGPPTQYLRQRSWPAPDVTPSRELPKPPVARISPEISPARSAEVMSREFPSESDIIMAQKLMSALSSIPDSVLFALLRQRESYQDQHQLRVKRQEDMVCRFCKNNGERESYYRSHKLRVRGRVACPVLRAYTCKRCGARGDHAHTIKYCPLATDDERNKSNALMRSLRMGSAHQRPSAAAAAASTYYSADYVVFGETSPSLLTDGAVYRNHELDPDWEALERKLML